MNQRGQAEGGRLAQRPHKGDAQADEPASDRVGGKQHCHRSRPIRYCPTVIGSLDSEFRDQTAAISHANSKWSHHSCPHRDRKGGVGNDRDAKLLARRRAPGGPRPRRKA